MMMKTLTSLLEMSSFLEKRKNKFENAHEVTEWTLFLPPDIQPDCMEYLSTDNVDLRKMVDEVVSWFYYPPCPNKKVAIKN